MNGIFVYVKAEAGKKIFIGSFADIATIECDVEQVLIEKQLTQYKKKVFMLIGTETYQIKF
ncbi:hypothetical protein IV487_01875 [Enterococcus saccharolyticus]|uniref:hypothetical protein n=1 Tax=Enterococcus saccharolyticus TaxID=41997 RepID=UPI001E5F86E4|nr:hypothetical protein [Enterococcus saccharolyticus]MCD5001212.1 hypothetical protein [Enterococcus saccharolyticus]